jgi:general secretion pathway protein L
VILFALLQDTRIVSSLTQDLTGIARQGFVWWTGELASLVPKRLRDGLKPARPGIIIELRDGRLSLVHDPSVPATVKGSGDPAAEQALLDRLARRNRPGSPAAVQLRLPHSACLVRRIAVPDRAKADAARILELDLERSTPLDAAGIYTAHYAVRGPAAKGTTDYVQLIVKKSTIDRAIARLEASGVTVAAVDCWTEDGRSALPVNLLEGASRGQAAAANTGRRLVPFLAALAALLAATSVWISISRYQTALADLETQTAEARALVAKLENGRDLSNSAANEAAGVTRLKAARPAVVQILDELTRLLPDTASLTEFSVEAGDVSISGFSKSASGLVPVLERSQMFADASLSAPVTFDDARNQERFSYRLRLRSVKPAIAPDAPREGDPDLPGEAAP